MTKRSAVWLTVAVGGLSFLGGRGAAAIAAFPAQPAGPAAEIAKKAPYRVEGVYVEACTCKSSCAADLTGENPMCNAMGAARIDAGAYDGKDIAGTRLAFA